MEKKMVGERSCKQKNHLALPWPNTYWIGYWCIQKDVAVFGALLLLCKTCFQESHKNLYIAKFFTRNVSNYLLPANFLTFSPFFFCFIRYFSHFLHFLCFLWFEVRMREERLTFCEIVRLSNRLLLDALWNSNKKES